MMQVVGTDVLHATYRYRADVRTSECFVPNMPLIDPDDADDVQLAELMAFVAATPARVDLLHRDNRRHKTGDGRPDVEVSVLSLPNAPDESLIKKREGIARGDLERLEFANPTLGNTRSVWV